MSQIDRKLKTNLYLVWRILDKYIPYNKEDYFTAGALGLLKAINSFDENKGKNFESWALFCIKNYVIDEIRKNSPSTRHQVNEDKKIELISVDWGDEAESNKYSPIEEQTPASEYEELDLKRFINDQINKLPDKKAEVLRAIINGEKMVAIGNKFNISKARVSQIQAEAIHTIRQNLTILEN